MSLFCCPICGAPLERLEQVYRCPNRHSYDIAAQGYTYLLPVSRKHSKAPGDDKVMSAARKAFLARDYYAPLQRALCRLACDLAPQGTVRVLDSGCGEGYYTAALYHALAQTRKVQLAGIDISKFILRTAARRLKEGEFAVASAYHLPLAADSVDLLLDCFAPLAAEEFRRVLRPGGHFLYVVPAARHLWQFKEVLYDTPYPNEEKREAYPGFSYVDVVPVRDTIHLNCREDIENLLTMTPYVWRTGSAGKERLAVLEELDTEIAFDIHVFRREN